jgi:hypothetical protein
MTHRIHTQDTATLTRKHSLRLPHAMIERETMHEDQGQASFVVGADFCIGQGFLIV